MPGSVITQTRLEQKPEHHEVRVSRIRQKADEEVENINKFLMSTAIKRHRVAEEKSLIKFIININIK